jgi:hypothetical protein
MTSSSVRIYPAESTFPETEDEIALAGLEIASSKECSDANFQLIQKNNVSVLTVFGPKWFH